MVNNICFYNLATKLVFIPKISLINFKQNKDETVILFIHFNCICSYDKL